jgi:UDP-N-acetylmuramate--alanine ligase
LAEFLASKSARLEGSDVPDVFYTDAILLALGIRVHEGFAAELLPPDCDLVIHSAAYSRDQNPLLLEARRRDLPLMSYPEALGALSRMFESAGIAGVHGKTTTTALAGSIAAAIGLPATIIAGSAVAGFGNRSLSVSGDRFLIAETCEYRRHFLDFSPTRIVLTSVEPDHQDYFPDRASIILAFGEYVDRLPREGTLIYCADDAGASEVAELATARRSDIRLVPYGETAHGPWRLLDFSSGDGRTGFRLAGLTGSFELRVPGKHLVLDAIAALALCASMAAGDANAADAAAYLSADSLAAIRASLASFSGSKRRSEILGEAGGVLFVDDYGHHPTAIARTLEGMRDFWPSRRLVVDFMSHTYSRTKALFGDFAACLDEADLVVLHRIYASARELPDPAIDGQALAAAVKTRAAKARHRGRVIYHDDPLGALGEVSAVLEEGDLFLTMGAGDNWRLGQALLAKRRKGENQP